MRFVLCGGGTGGHVYPALALAPALEARFAAELLYIGSREGLEARLVPASGLAFAAIPVRGMVGKGGLQKVVGAGWLAAALFHSLRLLRRFRPAAVVGTGGYVAGPPVWTAVKLGIPTLIQEQNAVPGVTNRILSRQVDAVAVPFPGVERNFPAGSRCFLSGNPVRPEVLTMERSEGRRRLGVSPDAEVVLVTSGSRGAREVNRAVAAAVPALLARPRTVVLWVTGERYAAEVDEALGDLDEAVRPRLRCFGYLDEMPAALAAADLAVSRAGGMTLAELTARRLPAVLIPSPNVTHDHQTRNAELFARAGAAVVIPERQLAGGALGEAVLELLQRPDRRRDLARRSRELGRPDAADRILDRLEALCGGPVPGARRGPEKGGSAE